MSKKTILDNFWSKLQNRFWSKVNITSLLECWIWTAQQQGDGYGAFKLNGKYHQAHRIAWEFIYGDIPKGLCVCHQCDNRLCVNPSHLFLGTYQDNADDKVKKNRQARMPGEMHPNHKLTKGNIVEIRQSNNKSKYLAIQFNVSISTIQRIRSFRSWSKT